MRLTKYPRASDRFFNGVMKVLDPAGNFLVRTLTPIMWPVWVRRAALILAPVTFPLWLVTVTVVFLTAFIVSMATLAFTMALVTAEGLNDSVVGTLTRKGRRTPFQVVADWAAAARTVAYKMWSSQ